MQKLQRLSRLFSPTAEFGNVRLDGVEALGTDDVFDLAGVLEGDITIDPESLEQFGQGGVTLENALGDGATRRQKMYRPIGIDRNMPVGLQVFHRHTDRRSRKAELGRDVDRSDVSDAIFKHKYGFEVILGGSLYLQGESPFE